MTPTTPTTACIEDPLCGQPKTQDIPRAGRPVNQPVSQQTSQPTSHKDHQTKQPTNQPAKPKQRTDRPATGNHQLLGWLVPRWAAGWLCQPSNLASLKLTHQTHQEFSSHFPPSTMQGSTSKNAMHNFYTNRRVEVSSRGGEVSLSRAWDAERRTN